MSQIIGTSGIALGDGEGGYIALSVKEQVMRNLHQSLATFLQARAPQSGSIIGGATIAYSIPLYGTTQEYEQGQNAQLNPNVELKLVNVSNRRTQFYEIESFDESMIAPDVIGNLIGQIAANLSTTIMADQNAHFFLALKDYFDQNDSQTLYLPQLYDTTVQSTTDKEYLQKSLLIAKANLQKVINNKYIGVRGNEFYGLVDVIGKTNIQLLLSGLNASDKAYDMILYGIGGDTLDTFELGGTKFIVDNFINRSIPENYSFNGDYEYDLSDYAGFLIHNEFMAFPMGLQTVTQVRNPNNGNIRWIAKYAFGSGVIRPELGYAFVKELKAYSISTEKTTGETFSIGVNIVCNASSDITTSNLTNCSGALVNGNIITVTVTDATQDCSIDITYNGETITYTF